MPKEKTSKEVFEDLSNNGQYEEAHLDKDEVERVKNDAIEDYEYGKRLREEKDQNWRVIFSIHYDALRQRCNQLMRFKEQKISNHQGVFAFIVLGFPEL